MIANDGATDDDLASVLAACDEALADGGLPDLGDATAVSPDQSRLLKGIECVRLMRDVWKRPSAAICPALATTIATRPDNIGRFRVLRELGRGGFGIVYLAFDPQVGRPLALKIPRPDLNFTPDLRERFQQEARTAGALDHPNVVPVYETGEADGVPFIASAYCPGPSLAAWLAKQTEPVPISVAAELIARLADGVAHAHAKGVIHRDLKPANILLMSAETKPDDTMRTESLDSAVRMRNVTLIPKVTDFGLAKSLLGTTDGAMTASGAILGTPNYLAPEQADHKIGPVGPSVDVYGLGAILYELLTRRPPFESDSVLDTLRQVRTEEPIPPRRLRTQVPRDVETICLKCLNKEPRKRYATAAALGDDLRRFLAGNPVVARPVSDGERLWRWCRRNPRVAGLSVALVLVFVAGVAGVCWQWLRAEGAADRARRDRDTAIAARRVAEQERERAAAETARARRVVNGMTDTGKALYLQKGQAATGRKILEDVIGYHEGFVADPTAGPSAVLEAAEAWAKVAEIRRDMGELTLSVRAFRRSIELYDRLLTSAPDDAGYRYGRAICTRDMANVLHRSNQLAAADRTYQEAAEALRQLRATSPLDPNYRLGLANTLLNLGNLIRNNDPDRAESLLKELLPLHDEMLAEAPANVGYRFEAALTREVLGLLLSHQERSERGLELMQGSQAMLRQTAAERPNGENPRWFLARSIGLEAMVLADADRMSEAEALFKESFRQLAEVRKDYPRNAVYAWQEVSFWGTLARARQRAGQSAEAEAGFRRALQLADRMTTDFPEEARARGESIGYFRAGLWLQMRMAGRDPEAAALLQMREQARDSFALAQIARMLADGTNAAFRDPARALELARRATTIDPKSDENWYVLGIALYRTGSFKEAAEAFEKAVALEPPSGERDGYYLAMARARVGASEQARAAFAAAEKRAHRRMQIVPELKALREEAASIVNPLPS